ncbi:MAG TPA: C25 family cysteine peptidase, partial [Pyrinomonadaceae bacterium]|nr:C25 family cysteine peptidase [Pyrinomonadaceae bacterium]
RDQGMTVAVAEIEDVYDEFSYGAHTPEAVKAFLATATSSWSRRPAFALLVGDSSWDPRNFMDQGANDFVPTKLIDTGFMETASDDWLVDFSGQSRADMAIGRLPGRTAAEITLMVSKILTYEQERELNAPLRGAVLVADTGFESQNAQTRVLLPDNVATQSIDRSQLGNDDLMRGQVLDALNAGPMIVNFYGHGSVRVWTGAGVLDSELAETLTNSNRSSIYLMMTCLNGYAHDAYVDSLSEAVLKSPNGGAVAVWASSGYTTPEPQFAMNSQFYRLLFGAQPMRLGQAAREAKLATKDLDVRRTWVLFGDPTMRVR